MVSSNFAEGPIFYNCFSDLTIPLSSKNIHMSVQLGVKTKGFDMDPGSENIGIMYRIYYKAMNSFISNIAYGDLIKNECTIFQTDFRNKTIIPKRPTPEKIEIIRDWKLQELFQPTPKIEHKASKIIQEDDGSVRILFENKEEERQNTFNKPIPPQYTTFGNYPPPPRFEEYNSAGTAQPVYTRSESQTETINLSPEDMIGVITAEEEEFKIDEAYLKAKMMLDSRIDKLLEKFDIEKIKKFQEAYIREIKLLKKHMTFFAWYDFKLDKNNKKEQHYLKVLKEKWTTVKGEIKESIHPLKKIIKYLKE